ncbi:App1 family protein [Mariniluteicoccus endophyticus]
MSKPFIAARIEDKLNRQIDRTVRGRGWQERVIGYTGYGSSKFVRVLGRVILTPPGTTEEVPSPEAQRAAEPAAMLEQRGWRNFVTAPATNQKVTVTVAGSDWEVLTDRNGYLDLRLPVRGLEPGWHEITLQSGSSEPVQVPMQIIDPEQEWGLVSDIDDTVISTSLPRPLVAAWNTFVLEENARQAVPGMSELYEKLLADHPDAPVVYVSTGAWNTAPTLERFFRHHRYPRGCMLLTDWGPTNSGWFRSGQEHKRMCLRDLAIDFPKVKWILIGDDGQHDPALYGEFAEAHPDRVRIIGIRQLSPGEQVLAHGTLQSLDQEDPADREAEVPEVRAPDGQGLWPLLQQAITERA